MASNVLAAPDIALSTSPSLRAVIMRAVNAARYSFESCALSTRPAAPTSHSGCRRDNARLARQKLSVATTATALPSLTTRTMPGAPESTDSSPPLSLPPGTGQALMAAKTIPGTCASIPNMADPLVLCARSTRGIRRGRKVNWSGDLIAGSLASLTFAASTASSP